MLDGFLLWPVSPTYCRKMQQLKEILKDGTADGTADSPFTKGTHPYIGVGSFQIQDDTDLLKKVIGVLAPNAIDGRRQVNTQLGYLGYNVVTAGDIRYYDFDARRYNHNGYRLLENARNKGVCEPIGKVVTSDVAAAIYRQVMEPTL